MDQIASARANDRGPQDTVGFLVSDDFDKTTLGLMHRLGAGIGHEVELANLDLATLSLERILSRANGGHFRSGVNHTGNDAVVHVAMLARNRVGDGHAFVFGLVGQHRAFDHVTNGVDARHVGGPMGIGCDLAALGQFHTQRVQTQTFGIRLTAGCNQHNIRVNDFFVAALLGLVFHLGFGLGGINALNRRTHDKVQTLLFEDLFEGALNVFVHAGADRVHIFNHGHLGAQARINRAQLKADDARADHDHFLGHFWQFQRTGAVDNHTCGVVNFNTWQRRRHRTRSNHDVLGRVGFITHFDLTRRRNRRPAFQPVDLVLLHQELNTTGVLADDLILVGLHLIPVDRRRFALQAHFGKVVLCLMQLVGCMQKRL